MSEKEYCGEIYMETKIVQVRDSPTGSWKHLRPQPSQRVWNHSPDGFSWGYGGSGPAQLALAILLDAYGEQFAKKHYQDFKWEFVAKWPMDGSWVLDAWQLRQFKEACETAEAKHE